MTSWCEWQLLDEYKPSFMIRVRVCMHIYGAVRVRVHHVYGAHARVCAYVRARARMRVPGDGGQTGSRSFALLASW